MAPATEIPGALLDALRDARHVCVLTGAGVSAESGVPTFRDAQEGLWARYRPEDLATPEAFLDDPALVWRWYRWRRDIVANVEPNPGHTALARLARLVPQLTLVTQNVDGLHQAAGSTDVIEYHGTFAWQRCMDCGKKYENRDVDVSKIPPRCDCGGILRPDAVFFGEMIPAEAMWRSRQAATDCDLMLVVGTSAVVQPAAMIPVIAKENGAKIVEINPERTPLTVEISDYLILGEAGKVINQILDAMEKI